jgi:hypothetical protein
MGGRRNWLWAVVVFLLLGALMGCAGDGDEGDGRALLEARCTGCHSLERVENSEHTRTEWEGIVDRMITYGADLNEEEQTILVDYLAENYGP